VSHHQEAVRLLRELVRETIHSCMRADYGLEPRGPRVPKVDDEQVAKIRELYASGDWTCPQLAQQFEISKHYVRAIVEGRRRRSVAKNPTEGTGRN
jgi:hypothetical protein